MNNVKTLAHIFLTSALLVICCNAWSMQHHQEISNIKNERRVAKKMLNSLLYAKREFGCSNPDNRYDEYCSGNDDDACGSQGYQYGCRAIDDDGNGCYCDNTCTVNGCPPPCRASDNFCTKNSDCCSHNCGGRGRTGGGIHAIFNAAGGSSVLNLAAFRRCQ